MPVQRYSGRSEEGEQKGGEGGMSSLMLQLLSNYGDSSANSNMSQVYGPQNTKPCLFQAEYYESSVLNVVAVYAGSCSEASGVVQEDAWISGHVNCLLQPFLRVAQAQQPGLAGRIADDVADLPQ